VATIRLDAFRASARARSQARLLLPDVRTLGRARPRAANRTGARGVSLRRAQAAL